MDRDICKPLKSGYNRTCLIDPRGPGIQRGADRKRQGRER